MAFPPLKQNVENALAACGRDRVFHRNDAVGVAIRFDAIRVEPPANVTPMIVGQGESYDDAAEFAISAFVARLRDAAKNLNEWASRIESALKEKR